MNSKLKRLLIEIFWFYLVFVCFSLWINFWIMDEDFVYKLFDALWMGAAYVLPAVIAHKIINGLCKK